MIVEDRFHQVIEKFLLALVLQSGFHGFLSRGFLILIRFLPLILISFFPLVSAISLATLNILFVRKFRLIGEIRMLLIMRTSSPSLSSDGAYRPINVLRHLVVPDREVEGILARLRDEGWLGLGFLILPSSTEGYRLVPIDASAPTNLPRPLSSFDIEMKEGVPDKRKLADWLNHLESLVGKEKVSEKGWEVCP